MTITYNSSTFLANNYTDDVQSYPAIATLSNGGFVVVWQSAYQEGSADYGVYGQRFDANGTAAGTEFHVNGATAYDQNFATVAGLADGGFVVSWGSTQADGTQDIYARRFDANGALMGNEFLVNSHTALDQKNPTLTALADGGFLIVWESVSQDGDLSGIYAKRYDAFGNMVGGEFQANTYTTSTQASPTITPLTDGGFVIVWASMSQDGSGDGIYAQRFDANENRVGSEIRINTHTTDQQSSPTVTPLNDGGFVVAWQSEGQDGSQTGIFAQRFDSDGVAVGAEFQVNSYTAGVQSAPAIATLSDGGFIIIWVSYGQGTGLSSIYGQAYDASGQSQGGEFLLANDGSYFPTPALATRSGGGFVAAWATPGGGRILPPGCSPRN
jgi:methionine-rich copper-binding protein CopC